MSKETKKWLKDDILPFIAAIPFIIGINVVIMAVT